VEVTGVVVPFEALVDFRVLQGRRGTDADRDAPGKTLSATLLTSFRSHRSSLRPVMGPALTESQASSWVFVASATRSKPKRDRGPSMPKGRTRP
jgi:hypothetical protein